MSMVYFQGSRTSESKLTDDKGLIGKFTNRGGTTRRLTDGTLVSNDDQIWIMEIPEDDKELLERVKKHPAFLKGRFKQVTHIPQHGSKQNVFKGAVNLEQIKQEAELKAQAEAEAKYQEKVEKFRKYYQLESELIKDGKPKPKADPEKLNEYETLKKELEI